MTFNKSNVIVSGSRSSLSEYANYTTVYPKPAMVGGKIVLTQDMINKQNVKYIIKWNFDLDDETITVPEGCLIEFDGGSFSNGTLVGNETILVYNQEEEDVFKNVSLEGSFERSTSAIADKMDNTNGMAKIYLKKNKPLATQLTQPNTIYVIQHDFVLDGDVTIPANCVLEFDGGSLSNGVLSCNNTLIEGQEELFINVTLQGTLANKEVYLSWFRLGYSSSINDALTINNILSVIDNCTLYYDIKNNVYIGGGAVLPDASIDIRNKNSIRIIQTTNHWTILKGRSSTGEVFGCRSITSLLIEGVQIDGNNIRYGKDGENGFGIVNCANAQLTFCKVKNTVGNRVTDPESEEELYDGGNYPQWGSGGKGIQVEGGATFAYITNCSIYDCTIGISNNQSSNSSVIFEGCTIKSCDMAVVALTLDSSIESSLIISGFNIVDCIGNNGIICLGDVRALKIDNTIVKGGSKAESLLRGCTSYSDIDILCKQNVKYLIDIAPFRDNPEGNANYRNSIKIRQAGTTDYVFGISSVYPKKPNGATSCKFGAGNLCIDIATFGTGIYSGLSSDLWANNAPFLFLTTNTFYINGILSEIDSSYNYQSWNTLSHGGSTVRPTNYIKTGFMFYDETLQRPIFFFNNKWKDERGYTPTISHGSTQSRPDGWLQLTDGGAQYYDTNIKKLIFLDIVEGTKRWVEYDNALAGVARAGSSSERPIGSSIYVGFRYFDTSLSPARPIYASAISDGTVTWVDATGTPV